MGRSCYQRRVSCKGLSGGSDRMSLSLNLIRLRSKLATKMLDGLSRTGIFEISRNGLSSKRAAYILPGRLDRKVKRGRDLV